MKRNGRVKKANTRKTDSAGESAYLFIIRQRWGNDKPLLARFVAKTKEFTPFFGKRKLKSRFFAKETATCRFMPLLCITQKRMTVWREKIILSYR